MIQERVLGGSVLTFFDMRAIEARNHSPQLATAQKCRESPDKTKLFHPNAFERQVEATIPLRSCTVICSLTYIYK